MNAYQKEQWFALTQAKAYLEGLSAPDAEALQAELVPYITFRDQLDQFLSQHCSDHCTVACFSSNTSACCSKDGIITFWADVLINACRSDDNQLEKLFECIRNPAYSQKCIYLGAKGCQWQVRPLVCTMFLCDPVQQALLDKDEKTHAHWQTLKAKAKSFRWPDRPVLFDHLEQRCITAGIQSTLMYLNNSPGLLRIKQKAGLITAPAHKTKPLHPKPE